MKEISPHEKPQIPRVWHFFFEWGYFYHDLQEFVGEEDLLAIELRFNKVQQKHGGEGGSVSLKSISVPSFEKYKDSFEQVKEHLLRGDCYQVNLSFPWEGKIQGDIESILMQIWKNPLQRGAYAHATYFPSLKKSFVSQSPECLFSLDTAKRSLGEITLTTMPIKGSLKFSQKDHFQKKWRELLASKKDKAELSMIVDLLRNDLNQIHQPCAQVLKKGLLLLSLEFYTSTR